MTADAGGAPDDRRITRVDIHALTLTYAHGDYVMSAGRVVNELVSHVVRITTAGGVVGVGETCPLGRTYLPASAEGVRGALGVLAPALIGLDAGDAASVRARLDATVAGEPAAKSALDVACWDAFGRATGASVSTLLGGRRQTSLPLYVAIPLGPPDEMAAFIERERVGGIHHFQLKIGGRPADDIARVAAALEAIGPDDALIADANGGWRRQDAIIAARAFEALPASHRLRLEQPCPTLEECLAVRDVTALPMVLDEVITDLAALRWALAARAMDHINLKVSRVGGLTPARTIRDVAVDAGLRLTIEDSWGGDVVSATVAGLAAAVPPEQLFAVSFMNDWTVESVAGGEPRSRDGFGPVPAGPGLGIEVDAALLGPLLITAE